MWHTKCVDFLHFMGPVLQISPVKCLKYIYALSWYIANVLFHSKCKGNYILSLIINFAFTYRCFQGQYRFGWCKLERITMMRVILISALLIIASKKKKKPFSSLVDCNMSIHMKFHCGTFTYKLHLATNGRA